MLISRIELFHVAMPLISPWRTAYGEDAAVHSVLCRMTSGSLAAWGESSSLAAPCYSPEWAGGVYAVLKEWLAPALVGQSIASGDELHQRLAHFKGNRFAKAALDNAWWSLHSLSCGKPLHVLLGEYASLDEAAAGAAAVRDEVPVGADCSNFAPAGTCPCYGLSARRSQTPPFISIATAAMDSPTCRCSSKSTSSAWR